MGLAVSWTRAAKCNSYARHTASRAQTSPTTRSAKTDQPTQGGYSEAIDRENYVLRIPDVLPLNVAAPLLCAGITLYSPLRHWNAAANTRVAIIGGLGHMGVQLGAALGADVTVLSQSLKKMEDGLRLGPGYYAAADPDTFRKLRGGYDLILNTVSG